MLTTIRSEVEFAALWFDYTNEDLPEIDFHSNVVVLYDRGFIDLNHCGSLAGFEDISAERLDNDITLVSANLVKYCPNPNIACPASVYPARPYSFISIPRSYEILVAESITIENCD